MTDISADDRLAIHELIARYSHVIDGRQWDKLHTIYTPDGAFDASQRGYPVAEGLDAVTELMKVANHPMAHHATNVVLSPIDSDTVKGAVMVITVRAGGAAATGDYRDLIVRTPAGWRFRKRTASLRNDDDAVPRPRDPAWLEEMTR
jgi:hypothetical protein